MAKDLTTELDGAVPEASPAAPEVTRTVVFFQHGDRGVNGTFDYHAVRALRLALARGIDSPHESTNIDVWLETPGGDAHAAYKAMLLLRSYGHRIRVIVPDWAKSAGTLFALGADEIYMAPGAELGPLDAQIGYEKEGMTISALDIARSLEDLSQTALAMALSGGSSVLDATGLSRSETLGAMVDFASKLMQPVMNKVDATMIHWSNSLLEVAVAYAERLLRFRRAVPAPFDSADVSNLPSQLVGNYPTHGFVIGRDEARALGLPVLDLEAYERHSDVVKFHEVWEGEHRNLVMLVPDVHSSADDDEEDDEAE